MIANDTLKSVGLAINTVLNLFVCLECGTGLTPKSVNDHHKKIHKNLKIIGGIKKQIQEIAERADLSEEYPDIEPSREPIPMFSGITVKSSAGCPACPYAGALKVVQSHMSKTKHQGKVEKDLSTQVINAGATRINLRVSIAPVVETTTTEIPDLLQQAKDFQWTKHQAAEIPNARMVSPWLLRTGWHEHIQPYVESIPELCDLVAMPQNGEFVGLHQMIKEYFDQATTLLDATDELVLQKLNSADPDKE